MSRGETYEEFIEKFEAKPRKTTDDCYTPQNVYEAVKDWAVKEYGWEGREIVRPFYPGGDYENYSYSDNCVVIDNPTFSIMSKIVNFYEERKISYFLFAPNKTLLGIMNATSLLGVGVTVTYDNGAKVATSFVCSEGAKLRSAPELYKRLDEANKANIRTNSKPRIKYPDNLVTFGVLTKLSRKGVDYRENSVEFVRRLDAQKTSGKAIYGAGYLVPKGNIEKALAEYEKQPEKQPLIYDYILELSEREREVVERLG